MAFLGAIGAIRNLGDQSWKDILEHQHKHATDKSMIKVKAMCLGKVTAKAICGMVRDALAEYLMFSDAHLKQMFQHYTRAQALEASLLLGLDGDAGHFNPRAVRQRKVRLYPMEINLTLVSELLQALRTTLPAFVKQQFDLFPVSAPCVAHNRRSSLSFHAHHDGTAPAPQTRVLNADEAETVMTMKRMVGDDLGQRIGNLTRPSTIAMIASGVFLNMDVDKTGTVNREMFCRYFCSYFSRAVFTQTQFPLIFRLAVEETSGHFFDWDSDSDTVNPNEHEWLKHCRKVFDLYDTNGDGGFDAAEALDLGVKLGQSREKSEAMADDLMATADLDGDGIIDFDEFTLWMRGVMGLGKGKEVRQKDVNRLKAQFNAAIIDSSPKGQWYKYAMKIYSAYDNGSEDGFDLDQATRCCKKMGYSDRAARVKAKQLFEAADADQDGVIDMHEFIMWLKQTMKIRKQLTESDVERLKKKFPLIQQGNWSKSGPVRYNLRDSKPTKIILHFAFGADAPDFTLKAYETDTVAQLANRLASHGKLKKRLPRARKDPTCLRLVVAGRTMKHTHMLMRYPQISDTIIYLST